MHIYCAEPRVALNFQSARSSIIERWLDDAQEKRFRMPSCIIDFPPGLYHVSSVLSLVLFLHHFFFYYYNVIIRDTR